jgi:hypothetical protein
MPAPCCAMGERLRAGAPADLVLRHAVVREGRQARLLLPRG